jgi:hypothetical protein
MKKKSRSYHELNIQDGDDKYNKGIKKPYPWFRLAITSILILGCLFLVNWYRKENVAALNQASSQKNTEPLLKESVKESQQDDTSKTYFWKSLPSSDVWCRGERRFDRYYLMI